MLTSTSLFIDYHIVVARLNMHIELKFEYSYSLMLLMFYKVDVEMILSGYVNNIKWMLFS